LLPLLKFKDEDNFDNWVGMKEVLQSGWFLHNSKWFLFGALSIMVECKRTISVLFFEIPVFIETPIKTF